MFWISMPACQLLLKSQLGVEKNDIRQIDAWARLASEIGTFKEETEDWENQPFGLHYFH